MMSHLNPVASQRARTLSAGVVWSGVGVMLLTWAAVWLSASGPIPAISFGVAGVAGALAAWWFGFRRLAVSNAHRIDTTAERACWFSFQATKSYAVMIGMIAFGTALRHSSLPRPWLAVLYSTVGGGLFLASMYYYRHARLSTKEN